MVKTTPLVTGVGAIITRFCAVLISGYKMLTRHHTVSSRYVHGMTHFIINCTKRIISFDQMKVFLINH